MPTTAPLTETDIIANAYYLLEQDSAGWDVASAEYLTARGLLQGAIGRWEFYDNVRWRDLWIQLVNAATGIKTLTAGTFSYACPTDMRYPSSWVRTYDASGTRLFWKVISSENLAWGVDNPSAYYCYFTGNIAIGFTLHFNPNVSLHTGDTIEYEYYKQALKTTATTDKPEMQDPWFAAYFIASHMADGGLDTDFMNMAEVRLDQMKAANMASLALVSEEVPTSLDWEGGFGR